MQVEKEKFLASLMILNANPARYSELCHQLSSCQSGEMDNTITTGAGEVVQTEVEGHVIGTRSCKDKYPRVVSVVIW